MSYTRETGRILYEQANVVKDFYDHWAKIGLPLHEGQADILRAIFTDGVRELAAQCGRNYGKTETAIKLFPLFCALNPNSITYIIAPQRKQGKEIYWASNRLQRAIPEKYIAEIKESELRIVLPNSSFICVDGCENWPAHRGIKPNLVGYDEFQEHTKEFHTEVMEPNLIAKNSILVVLYTPPKRDCYCIEYRKNLLEAIEKGDKTRRYFECPSSVNPSLDPAELEKKQREMIKRGDEKIWLREYEAKLIMGGEDAVFPRWDRKKHVFEHSLLLTYLAKDKPKLRWFTICDPGSTSCFAVLFACHNPYTSQLFILDEIYEKDNKLTHTSGIWPRILEKEKELYDGKWRRIYDEAAAWFAGEVQANYKTSITPTNKKTYSVEQNIGTIKNLMAEETCLFVSKRCEKLAWEIENYITDDDGELIDKDDHLINCFCYLVAASNFKFLENSENRTGIIRTEKSLYTSNVHVVQNIENTDWADQALEDSLIAFEDDYY